jgi:succinate dehydrogenase/fumarate reductase flavoprotein subunit
MAASASLFREESRWGLYHNRVDFPTRNDAEWFTHCHLRKAGEDGMESYKKPVEPYLFPLDDEEKSAYQRLRVVAPAQSA